MKKSLLLSLVLISISGLLMSQSYVFHENFELPSGADSVVATTLGTTNWAINTTYSNSGAQSFHKEVEANDTATVTTISFSTLGSYVVYLNFAHICKIDYMDGAEIHVSNNGGTSWIKLTDAQYQGSAAFATWSNRFSSVSYPEWMPGSNTTPPNNAWWKNEVFDISSLVSNSADVKVKFVLLDLGTVGGQGAYGWLLDDIRVWIPSAQEASIEGMMLPLSLESGCGLTFETIQIRIANNGSQNISGNLTASFQRDGLAAVTESVTATIIPYDTLTYTFSTPIDLSTTQDTSYFVKTWVSLLNDPNQANDTLLDTVPSKIALPDPVFVNPTIPYGSSVTLTASHTDSITWSTDPLGANIIQYGSSFTTPVLYDTATYYVQAGASSGGVFIVTEMCHFKTATGSPVGGWPPYLLADDYIEITGVPNSDLGGYTLEQWSTSAMNGTHTFPPGTLLSPNGTAVIAVGQLGSSSPSPANFYYHGNGNYTGSYGSSTAAGRIIKDPTGTIVDAAGYGNYNFPAAANVPASEWSNPVTSHTGVSTSGFRLIGPDDNTGANWVVSSATNPQDPNTLNSGVILPSPSGCPSRVVPFRVYVSGIPHNDAGVVEVSPLGSVDPSLTYPITVRIQNFGIDTLKKADIHYTLNGVAQAVYNWTGNLPYNAVSSPITLTSTSFTLGVTTIKAWTSMPNDSVDWANHNDTLQSVVYTCLGGTLTLGQGGALSSFSELFSILDSAGLCGNTVVNVLPGTYTEQLNFNPVSGLSDTSRLTIQSSTGNPADVTIEFASTGTADNWVIKFDGVGYISLKNMTIKATGASFGRVLEFANGSHHIEIDGNILETSPTSTSGNFTPVYSTSNTASTHIVFNNNTFKGGYYAMYWYALAATQKNHLTITNNIIEDFHYYGLYIYRTDSVFISNNKLTNRTTSGLTYGIYHYYSNGYSEITANKLHLQGTSTQYGITIGYKQATSTNPLLLANNFVTQAGATGTVYGIYLLASNYVNVYHNSVNVAGGSVAGGRALFQTTGGNINIVNNIFSNTGGGYAYYVNTPSAIITSNNNNYSSSGINLAYWNMNHTTLAGLRTSSLQDVNSLDLIPPFTSPIDLYLTNTILSGKGTSLASVTHDIDSNIRSSASTIGAHEVPLIAKDAGVIAFINPTSQSMIGEGGSVTAQVMIQNFGTDTLTSVGVSYIVNQGTPVDTIYQGQILPMQTALVTLPSYISPAGNIELCAYTILAGDSNTFNDTACIMYYAIPLIDGYLTRIMPIETECDMALDTIRIVIENIGVNIIAANFSASYQLDGNPTIVTETVPSSITSGDSLIYAFSTLADFSINVLDSIFIVHAWIDISGDNVSYNDSASVEVISLSSPPPPIVSDTTIPYASFVTLYAQSPDSVIWYAHDTSTVELVTGNYYTTPVLYDTTTYWLESMSGSMPGAPAGNFIITEMCHFKTATGAPVGGWPPYLLADDYIEIAGVSGSDLGGYTLEQWSASAMNGTHTFPSGTLMSPDGTAIIAVGQLGSSSPSPANFYYHGNGTYTGSYGSSTVAGRILKDPNGNIIDAVGYGNYNFPATANVPASEWSNPVTSHTGVSTSGFRLIGPDDNTGANWVVSSAIHPQDPNIMNAGVPPPLPLLQGCPSLRVPLTVNVMGIPPYDLGIDELLVKEGCAVYDEPVTIKVFNQGTDTMKGGATASFRVDNNPWVATETINDHIPPGGSIYYTFSALATLTPLVDDTMFTIWAWVNHVLDPNQQNDSIMRDSIESLLSPAAPTVISPVNIAYGAQATLSASSSANDTILWFTSDTASVEIGGGDVFVTPPVFDTTTFWAEAVSGSTSTSGSFIITEICHYKYSVGAPIGGWPTYLLADDYIEITGVPGSDLGGYTLEQWSASAMNGTHTFASGTILSPGGTAVIAVGQLGSSSPSPANFYYHGNGTYTGLYSSNTLAGRIIKDPSGNIVDAVGYGNYTFPPAANVPASEWSNPVTSHTGVTTSGFRLIGPDDNTGANWVVTSATHPQDPNLLNSGVSLPQGLGCYSLRVPVQVNTSPPPPVDAGIQEIVHPVVSAPSGVPQPIQVRLRNYGTTTLTSVNIMWSVDGVQQTNFAWTGSLAYGTTQVVTIDTMAFAGGVYCLDAWTNLPNGVADTVPTNDTAMTSCFSACFSGIYTIGIATTGTYDYNTFNAALADLDLSGVCGPVIFEVYPGTYNEQLDLDDITGMSSVNTVSFIGVTGDSTDAVIQFASNVTANNYVIRLSDARYFTFSHLTVRATGASFGRVFEFMNDASYNTISNCVIESSITSTSSNFAGIYSTSNIASNHVLIENSHFKGGYYSIYWYGSTANRKNNIRIINNIMTDWHYYGIQMYYTDSVFIHSNEVVARNTTGIKWAIQVYYTNGYGEVNKNRVHLPGGGASTQYGISLGYKQTTSPNPLIVANNFVSQAGATGTVYGIYLIGSNYVNLYYNSVNVTGGSATGGRALYQTTGSNISIVNNIFNNSGGGYAFYINTPTAISNSNYNCFFSTGTNLAYWSGIRSSLSALQSASSRDGNSVHIDPPFFSLQDLSLTNTMLSALGTSLPQVTDDIFGNPRSPLPTIGAYEFPLVPIDAGVTAIISPGATTNEGQIYPVVVTLTNFGTDTITSMGVEYSINNGPPVSVTWTGVLPPFANTNFTMPSMTSPAGNSAICARTLLVGDTNTFNDEFCHHFFGNPSYDAMASSVFGPESDCGMGLDTISVMIRNLGANTINSPSPSTITVSYQVDGLSPVVTETVTQIIVPNDSVLHTFQTLYDFSVTTLDSNFTVVAWVSLAGDNVTYNDTAVVDILSLHTPLPPVIADTTIPYGTSVTLFAQSPDTVLWFAQDTASTEIAQGNYYTTPILYNNTTYWLEAVGGAAGGSGGSGGMPELLYYKFDVPGTLVENHAQAPVGNNPATITGTGLSIGGVGLSGTALQGTGVSSSGGVINTGWSTNLSGSFTLAFWTSNIVPSSTLWYIWGDVGAGSLRCFTNGAAGANNWMLRGGGLPDLTITGAATMAPNMIHAVYDAVAGQYRGYVNGVLTATVSAPNSNVMNGSGFQIGGYSSSTNLNGLMDEFRIYNRALTEAEILATYGGTLGAGGCASPRVSVNVTVSGQKACDVGVSRIVNPVTAVHLGGQENVTIRLMNYGTASQTNIPVSFRVGTSTVVTETVASTIAANDSLDYTFSATASFAVAGHTYDLWAWTSLACDSTAQNDTAYRSVTNLLPVYCPSNATTALYQEITNVTLNTLNNTSPANGAMYTDFSSSVIPTMLSPGISYPISITSSFAPGATWQYGCWVKVWIDFNRDGVFDPQTEMVFSQATTSSNTVTGTVNIPHTALTGNTMMRVVLNQTTNESLVSPCGTYLRGETEDYMIAIAPQAACDAGVIQIISPGGLSVAGSSQPVWVKFMNFGSDPIAANTLSIAYELNGGTPVIVPYAGGMTPMQIDSIQMPNIVLGQGANTLCAYTILGCDSTTFNDESCRSVFGQFQTNLPFSDNFDQANNWYNADPMVWERGTPAGTTINAAHSSPNAWMTKLATDYPNNANAYLYSPRFNFSMLTANDTAVLSFWHRMHSQLDNDGGMIQRSVDGGTNWANIGYIGDPLATNWYNSNVTGTHCWTGTIPWTKVVYKLDPAVYNQSNPVQFRFRFFSNASINNFDGWAIDDFEIEIPQAAHDVGVSYIWEPSGTTTIGSQVNVTVRITNYGTMPQISIPLGYRVGSNAAVSEIWTGALQPGDTALYTFATPYTSPSSAYNFKVWTALAADNYKHNDTMQKIVNVQAAALDLGVISINDISYHDTTYVNLADYEVSMEVVNFGTSTVTSFDIEYLINGISRAVETVTRTLTPGDTQTVVFTTRYTSPMGMYTLCGRTILAGDADPSNDESCISYIGAWNTVGDRPQPGAYLGQNRPNPANDITVIDYSIPASGMVVFEVHNLLGQPVYREEGNRTAGTHRVELDLNAFPAGVYSYGIVYDGYKISKKMIIVK